MDKKLMAKILCLRHLKDDVLARCCESRFHDKGLNKQEIKEKMSRAMAARALDFIIHENKRLESELESDKIDIDAIKIRCSGISYGLDTVLKDLDGLRLNDETYAHILEVIELSENNLGKSIEKMRIHFLRSS